MPTYTGSKAQAGRGSQLAIGPAGSTLPTPPTGVTGTTTSSSTSVTAVSSTVGLAIGMGVSGTNIPVGATVAAFTSNTITLSIAATGAGTATPLTFTNIYLSIGEVKTATPVDAKFSTENVSNFDSNIDEEYIKLMRNNGQIKVSGNRVSSNAGQLAVVAAFNDANNPYQFQVTLPKRPDQTTTGDVYTYAALVMGQSFQVETAKAVTFDLELQITGPVTFTAGS